MPLKDLIDKLGGKMPGKGGAQRKGRGYSIDDLIVLKRYDDAEIKLRERLQRNSSDLRSRLKLADVFMATHRRSEALEEYLAISDSYARDGFHDKAIALLSKVSKLVPDHEKTRERVERLRRAKRLEHRRSTVSNALLEGGEGRASSGSSAFEFQRLWHNLIACHLMESLDEGQLSRLFRALEFVHLHEGIHVADKGQQLEELYIVASGGVEALLELAGDSATVIRSFEPGDVFGERALLEHKPWLATYRTNTRSTLLKLTRDSLQNALMGDSDPRGLLDALRQQRLDSKVAKALEGAGTS